MARPAASFSVTTSASSGATTPAHLPGAVQGALADYLGVAQGDSRAAWVWRSGVSGAPAECSTPPSGIRSCGCFRSPLPPRERYWPHRSIGGAETPDLAQSSCGPVGSPLVWSCFPGPRACSTRTTSWNSHRRSPASSARLLRWPSNGFVAPPGGWPRCWRSPRRCRLRSEWSSFGARRRIDGCRL